MKSAIVALCFVACAYAAVLDKDSKILEQNYQKDDQGNYQFSFNTENGIRGEASASVKVVGKDEVALEVTGSNSYVGPDGVPYELSFVANENGYQPQGAHLPTPPAPEPIPEYIAKAIKYIAEHPYVEKKL